MTSVKVYYVLGQLVYAMARANEPLNDIDRSELQDLFVAELSQSETDVDFPEVISHILNKEKKDLETTYNWVIQSLKLQQSKLEKENKSEFLSLIEQVVNRFPSTTAMELEYLDRLTKDFQTL